MTRKYVITFTRSTVGNIFGDYSLKFRVTRHSSPLPIVPTRSNISTRSAIAASFSSPCSNPNLSLPRIQPRSREVRGKLGRMATTTREWKQQRDTIIGRKITNFLRLTYERNFIQLLDIIGNTYMEGKRAFLVNWLIFLLVLNKGNTLIFACNNRTINFTRNYTKSQN